jgi:lysophospholipase L1-like esterase
MAIRLSVPSVIAIACFAIMLPSIVKADKPALVNVRAALESGKHPVKIVCFGDSITGIYYHTGGRRAWPEMLGIALKQIYPNSNAKIVNSGLSDDSTIRALARFERDVLVHQPDLVVVMFGMNDIVRLPRDQFRENLLKIVHLSQASGAAVILGTQNTIVETEATGGRTNQKLAEFAEVVRQVGQSEQIPVADCYTAYETIRARDERTWQMLLSDPFHPNMNGHKRIAELVAEAITGKSTSLENVGPPVPSIPKTLQLLRAGKPVSILAMPPYDRWIEQALRAAFPNAEIKVNLWPVAGKTSTALMETTLPETIKDLVVVAVPLEITPRDELSCWQFYSRLLNNTLSSGRQEWDVIVIPPSLTQVQLSAEGQRLDGVIQRVIAAQDLGSVNPLCNDRADVADLLTKWLNEQVQLTR